MGGGYPMIARLKLYAIAAGALLAAFFGVYIQVDATRLKTTTKGT